MFKNCMYHPNSMYEDVKLIFPTHLSVKTDVKINAYTLDIVVYGVITADSP